MAAANTMGLAEVAAPAPAASQPMMAMASPAAGGPQAWEMAMRNQEVGGDSGGGGQGGSAGGITNNEGMYLFTFLMALGLGGIVAMVAGGFKAQAVGMAGFSASIGGGSAWGAGW